MESYSGDNNESVKEESFSDKIIRGGNLAIQRLIARKQKEDGYLVIERNGEVVKLSARDIVLTNSGENNASSH